MRRANKEHPHLKWHIVVERTNTQKEFNNYLRLRSFREMYEGSHNSSWKHKHSTQNSVHSLCVREKWTRYLYVHDARTTSISAYFAFLHHIYSNKRRNIFRVSHRTRFFRLPSALFSQNLHVLLMSTCLVFVCCFSFVSFFVRFFFIAPQKLRAIWFLRLSVINFSCVHTY